MNCGKCGKELSGKQLNWCSLRCSKLGLKSLYRKRNRDKVHLYNKWYRSLGRSPLSSARKKRLIGSTGCCERCKTRDNLNIHHFKPLRFGGTNERFNLHILCFACHMDLEQRMKSFWV